MDFQTFEVLFYSGSFLILLIIVCVLMYSWYKKIDKTMDYIKEIRDHLCGDAEEKP